MRWDDSGLRFPRPVRWRLAMLNSTRIVGERSYGHRFSSGPIEIADAAGYAEALRAVNVEPDSEERRTQIVAALDALGDWTDPHGVLAEVVYLVESPVVLDCSFDERYLQLPSRVVETTIQHHIRAFPLGGNRFAFVANGGDPDTVRAGVENVVGGRLEDASFTFERDLKVGIDALAERLGAITFFHGAGSFADKTERLVKLVEALGGGEAALEAARLAKADQASELVREFPELEGHVGAEYARLAGLPGSGLRRDRRAVPARRGGSASADDRDRPRALRRGQDRHAQRLVRPWDSGRRAHATRTGCGAQRSASGDSRPRATSRSRAS